MSFSDAVLARFAERSFQGFDFKPDATGLAGSFETGQFVVLGVRCQDNSISKAGFRSFNCVGVIAAADWTCEQLLGRTLHEARQLKAEDILTALGGLPASRRFCAALVQKALQVCLNQAQEKGVLTP